MVEVTTKVTPEDDPMPIVPTAGGRTGGNENNTPSKVANLSSKAKWDVRNSGISRIPIPTKKESEAPQYYDARLGTHPEVLEDVGTITTLRPGKEVSLTREEREALAKEKAKRSCFGTVYKLEIKDPWVAMQENLEFKHLNKTKEEDKVDKTPAEKEKDRLLLHSQMSEEEKTLAKARERRVTSFQEAADEAIGKFGSGDDMASIATLLQPEDELVQSIHVVEISGMPSTTDFIVISGAIEVALVRGKPTSPAAGVAPAAVPVDDARLLFSVSRGLSNINVAEEFSYQRLEATGCMACCFPPSCINCCCPCFLNGDFWMDYSIQHDFTSQFFILPVAPCVIDAMSFKETHKEFSASSAAAKPKAITCYCIDFAACFACCACCPKGCCNCGEPTRVAPVLFLDAYATQASTSLGREEKGDKVQKPVVDGLEWSVEVRGSSDIFVVMHYVSLLNGDTETCSMRLDREKTTFTQAKQFVANIGRHRARVQHHNVLASALPGFTKTLSAGAFRSIHISPLSSVHIHSSSLPICPRHLTPALCPPLTYQSPPPRLSTPHYF